MRRFFASGDFGAAVLVLCTAATVLAQTTETPSKPKRPSLNVKAAPGTGIVPIQVTAAAELKAGDDDFEEYYCPTIEWNWGDGTVSESSNDCEPYESGKSQIRRRYTVTHTYKRPGAFRISFRLKNRDKVVAAASATVRLLGDAY